MEAVAICMWSLMAAFALGATQMALLSADSGGGGLNPSYLSGSAQLPLAGTLESEPRRGAVASENRLCSRIGTDLLEAGGNAADALVGTVLCVGTIGMYHSGIGGGGFMLVRDKLGNYESIDFREAAPEAADENMYKHNINGSIFGGTASGVPGELRGLEHLHKKYGQLPWSDVVMPAVHVARDGFTVSKDLYKYMVSATAEHDFLTHDPVWAEDFAPNGTRVGLNDTLTRKRYADTLEAVARGGVDVFYRGAMAEATVRAVQASNGSMTLKDLADYEALTRPTAQITYRDFRLFAVGAPASGAVALSALKTVEGYSDLGSSDALNLSTHRLDEAIRFAYGERGALGDPFFVKGMQEYEAEMLSADKAAERRDKISDAHTLNVSDYNPAGYEVLEDHGTSHVVTADADGMAVTLTTTLNLIFGSRVMVPETGVVLNDQMDDFSVPGRKNAFGYVPSPSNYIRPRKRPLSSITPVIAEHASNRTLFYVVGAAGGSRITTATVQNIWHVLDHGLNASASLAMPRFHDQLLPNVVAFEWSSDNHTLHDRPGVPGHQPEEGGASSDESMKRGWGAHWMHPPRHETQETEDGGGRQESGIGTGFVQGYDNDTVAFMTSRGHNVSWVPPGYSSAQAIRLCWNGTFEAAGEPRQADSGGFAV